LSTVQSAVTSGSNIEVKFVVSFLSIIPLTWWIGHAVGDQQAAVNWKNQEGGKRRYSAGERCQSQY